jgi:hypothetical protein
MPNRTSWIPQATVKPWRPPVKTPSKVSAHKIAQKPQGARRIYPWDEMVIGEPVKLSPKAVAAARVYGRKHDMKFRCVTINDDTVEITRVK